jgi:enoyl-CoA hydratase/carnithine racemase
MSDTVAGPGEPLLVEREAGIWFACLSRPDRRNALTDGIVGALCGLLSRIAAVEPAALRATKRIVALVITEPLPAALDAAALEFAGLLRHGDVHEGVAAARGKRAPAWRAFVPELPGFL